jgi:hypothetical protein
MLEKLGNAVAEAVIPGMVTSAICNYAGDGCCNLKTAILLDIDVFQLWVENAEQEGITDLQSARKYARMAPSGKNLLTVSNVRRWFLEKGMTDVIRIIDGTPGGTEWFDKTIQAFRKGLWE